MHITSYVLRFVFLASYLCSQCLKKNKKSDICELKQNFWYIYHCSLEADLFLDSAKLLSTDD